MNALTGEKEKFKERLNSSNRELVDYVHNENRKRTRKKTKGLKAAALEIARWERGAVAAIHREMRELLATGTYGYAPRGKPDDVFRLMFENWNSLGVFTGNRKIARINRLATEYEVDAIAGLETQCDWRFAENDRQFGELFGVGKQKRSVVGYNKREKAGRDQKGGTAMMAMGRMSAFIIDTGVDHTELGRWSWILVGAGAGDDTQLTRIVAAYQPCEPGANSKGSTVFEQQQRCFEARGDFRLPRTIFFDHLIADLKRWKGQGEEIILLGYFNKNVYTGRIAQRLAQDDLNMSEQCRKITGKPIPPTYVRGSRPIDAVFATSGIVCRNASILAKYGGVGDHRCFILDFSSVSMLGSVFPRIVPPAGRKLHCNSERIRKNYCSVLNELADRHQMFRKLNGINRLADSMTVAEFQLIMNKWDDELTDYICSAESKCNKFHMGTIDYSPEANAWLRRRWLHSKVTEIEEDG